jgi:hypothetical protein
MELLLREDPSEHMIVEAGHNVYGKRPAVLWPYSPIEEESSLGSFLEQSR